MNNFNETILLAKKEFYSNLNMENITDDDCKHTKRVWEDLEIKYLGEYHDLYLHSNMLLLADVFESFCNKFIETFQLDPAHFLSGKGKTC